VIVQHTALHACHTSILPIVTPFYDFWPMPLVNMVPARLLVYKDDMIPSDGHGRDSEDMEKDSASSRAYPVVTQTHYR
jgi:hypothetical protein